MYLDLFFFILKIKKNRSFESKKIKPVQVPVVFPPQLFTRLQSKTLQEEPLYPTEQLQVFASKKKKNE